MRAKLSIVTTVLCAVSLAKPVFAQLPDFIPPGAPPVIATPPSSPISVPRFSPDGSRRQRRPAQHAPSSMPSSDKPADRKILNTTTAQLEYRIDTVGPSGISRVDIYITRDRGQSWEKLAEDTNKRSPVSINLPGEGLYGVRLAITNGNGFGGRAPKSGDRPQYVVEVDATSPRVEFHPYEIVNGAIDIRWSASDANLGPEPVNLFYRARADQSWQPIARNVKNDGVYRWAFPPEIGGQVFVKLEVADLAGNMTKVETPTPIMLDQTEPEATLLDVVGLNRGPAAQPVSMPPTMPPTGYPTSPYPPAAAAAEPAPCETQSGSLKPTTASHCRRATAFGLRRNTPTLARTGRRAPIAIFGSTRPARRTRFPNMISGERTSSPDSCGVGTRKSRLANYGQLCCWHDQELADRYAPTFPAWFYRNCLVYASGAFDRNDDGIADASNADATLRVPSETPSPSFRLFGHHRRSRRLAEIIGDLVRWAVDVSTKRSSGEPGRN